MSANQKRRLTALEQRQYRYADDSEQMLQILDWFAKTYGHLVDWRLAERLEAAAHLRGAEYTREACRLIVDYVEAASERDPAAGQAFWEQVGPGMPRAA